MRKTLPFVAGFEDGKRPWAKKCEYPLDIGKIKGVHSS